MRLIMVVGTINETITSTEELQAAMDRVVRVVENLEEESERSITL